MGTEQDSVRRLAEVRTTALAMCGTCGQPRSSSAHTSYGASIDHRFIPAPVVPSDERCEDCETLSGMDDDGRFVMCEQHAREFTAPPTPSQDAEGDGRVPSWTIGSWPPPRGTVVLHFRHHDDFNGVELPAQEARELAFMLLDRAMSADGDANWWANDARREAIESAIRAPYEELVKAARVTLSSVQDAGGLDGRCGWCGWRELHLKSCPLRTLEDALTHIEESLGGRS